MDKQEQAKDRAEKLATLLTELEADYVNARETGADGTIDYYLRAIPQVQDEIARLLYIAQGGVIEFI